MPNANHASLYGNKSAAGQYNSNKFSSSGYGESSAGGRFGDKGSDGKHAGNQQSSDKYPDPDFYRGKQAGDKHADDHKHGSNKHTDDLKHGDKQYPNPDHYGSKQAGEHQHGGNTKFPDPDFHGGKQHGNQHFGNDHRDMGRYDDGHRSEQCDDGPSMGGHATGGQFGGGFFSSGFFSSGFFSSGSFGGGSFGGGMMGGQAGGWQSGGWQFSSWQTSGWYSSSWGGGKFGGGRPGKPDDDCSCEDSDEDAPSTALLEVIGKELEVKVNDKLSLTKLFAVDIPDGSKVSKLEITDVGAGGSYLELNGKIIDDASITLAVKDLAGLKLAAGSEAGDYSFELSVADADGNWSNTGSGLITVVGVSPDAEAQPLAA